MLKLFRARSLSSPTKAAKQPSRTQRIVTCLGIAACLGGLSTFGTRRTIESGIGSTRKLTLTERNLGTNTSTSNKIASLLNSATPVSTNQTDNPIVTENQMTGTSEWQLTNPAINREVEGYASQTSINRGETIDLFVSSDTSIVKIDLFRMGWYQGLGARRMINTIEVPSTKQNTPSPNENGLISCNWDPSFKLQTNSTWTSGVYLAKLTENTNDKQSYIMFVVRDDNHSADLVFQLPVTTYQAYNAWGGKSAYAWGSGESLPWGSSQGSPATRISFNRPYARSTNEAAAYGVGAGEFLTNNQPVAEGYPISSAGWDYNYVRWFEREGYSVTYTTNLDTHFRPESLANAKGFISVGHDEYWSHDMRTNVETALNDGLNLGFLGANALYWQIRFSDDPVSQTENRVMDIYKQANLDPYNQDDDPNNDYLITTRFRDIGQSEDALLGVRYYAHAIDSDIVISNASHFLFNNTGLNNGDRLVV